MSSLLAMTDEVLEILDGRHDGMWDLGRGRRMVVIDSWWGALSRWCQTLEGAHKLSRGL